MAQFFVNSSKRKSMNKPIFIAVLGAVLAWTGCVKENDDTTTNTSDKYLEFKFKFDPTQARLGATGQAAPMPAGHAGQNPSFRKMSVHYIELAPSALTPLGQGKIIYKAAETTAGGANAIDFSQALVEGENTVFFKYPLKDIPANTYEWIRVSVAYQNYDVNFNINNVPIIGNMPNQSGTLASFVGFNTYIGSVTPRAMTQVVNDDKKQGYWVFETNLTAAYTAYNRLNSGAAPEGATTVVNPIFATSPIPAGSCVVTGAFLDANSATSPLVVPGNETANKTVTLSFSTNKSFEWIDANGNGQWDIDAAGGAQEAVVDMGLRGLKPIKN